MKILYYLPAIGQPNLDVKQEILLHNLNYIYRNIKQNFSVCINLYSASESLTLAVKSLDFIDHVYVHEKIGGILTELFLTNPYNDLVSEYEYVLFVLDDVKIIDIDIATMIEVKQKFQIEVLSPKILRSSHKFMNEHDGLTLHNFLEIYLLLMNPANFNTFLNLYTIENKWMWGSDCLFGYYNIKAAVLNKYVAKHELSSKSPQSEAGTLCNDFLKKTTPFKSLEDIRSKYSPIYDTIQLDN
jgi:hypothetical protein